MKKYLIIPLAAMLLAACEKEKEAPVLTIEPVSLEFTAEGGSQTLTVKSNQHWTITTDGADWYTVSPMEGNGDGEVTVTIGRYTEAATRSAQLTFRTDGLMKTAAILQNRPETPKDPTELSFNVRAYEQDFSIPAPKGFTYKTSVEGEGVTVVSSDEEKIVLHFDANTTSNYRVATLTVTTTDDIQLEKAVLLQSWRNIEPGELLIEEVFFSGFTIPESDNPDVPNLVNWFKSSWSITMLHDRGYESYAIAVAPAGTTSESFMKEHPWEGTRVMDFNGYYFEKEITDAYIIPNSWVLDAVNGAVIEGLGTLAFNATVDAGYTNVSTIDRDPERFGKSGLRKRDADGKIVDTNNSTNDFTISVPPTMKK